MDPRRTSTRLLLGLLAAALAAPLTAREFTIDPAHSDVGFTVRHMVVSNVRGAFTGVSGTIVLHMEHPERSSVRAVIDAASIDTRNEERDTHLTSPDFLDAARYPEIRFVSETVRREGDLWTASGTLTLHGRHRPVELVFRLNGPVADPWGNLRLGIEVEPIVLDRKEFGLTWNQTLDNGGLVVGDDVTVHLTLEAVAPGPSLPQNPEPPAPRPAGDPAE